MTAILLTAFATFGVLFLLVLAISAHTVEINDKTFGGER